MYIFTMNNDIVNLDQVQTVTFFTDKNQSAEVVAMFPDGKDVPIIYCDNAADAEKILKEIQGELIDHGCGYIDIMEVIRA